MKHELFTVHYILDNSNKFGYDPEYTIVLNIDTDLDDCNAYGTRVLKSRLIDDTDYRKNADYVRKGFYTFHKINEGVSATGFNSLDDIKFDNTILIATDVTGMIYLIKCTNFTCQKYKFDVIATVECIININTTQFKDGISLETNNLLCKELLFSTKFKTHMRFRYDKSIHKINICGIDIIYENLDDMNIRIEVHIKNNGDIMKLINNAIKAYRILYTIFGIECNKYEDSINGYTYITFKHMPMHNTHTRHTGCLGLYNIHKIVKLAESKEKSFSWNADSLQLEMFNSDELHKLTEYKQAYIKATNECIEYTKWQIINDLNEWLDTMTKNDSDVRIVGEKRWKYKESTAEIKEGTEKKHCAILETIIQHELLPDALGYVRVRNLRNNHTHNFTNPTGNITDDWAIHILLYLITLRKLFDIIDMDNKELIQELKDILWM